MKPATFLTGCALMLAQPVLAQPVTLMMIPRDSDGIVISVLHPVDYFLTGGTTNGGVVYTMGGVEVQFSHGAGGVSDTAGGPVTIDMVQRDHTATVGATTYKVEMSGTVVYLRDPVTGALYATQRVANVNDANGLEVNPIAFALE